MQDGAGPWRLVVELWPTSSTLLGGISAWIWGTLCAVDMLWVRADQRRLGWGAALMRAAEEEGVRRGCTEMIVSSFTFQAPEFYRGLGFRETGRTEGIPGRHQDVHFHKHIDPRRAPQPERRDRPSVG